MGMYTGLRIRVKLKPEFIPAIQTVMDGEGDSIWSNLGYDFLDEWAKVGRSNFIPNGALAYMPWDKNDSFWQDSLTLDGEWQFQCSLKNYENEVENFIVNVLGRIIEESLHVEVLYEEWDSSDMYKFIDNKWELLEDHSVNTPYDAYQYGGFV
jgi:hypothetical protein